MKKKNVIIIILVVVVVGLGIFAAWKGSQNTPQTVNTATPTSTLAQSTSTANSSTPSSSTPVTVSIEKTYSGGSFSFSYPLAWSVSAVSPFSLTTFNGKYLKAGIIPPGGAVVEIATTTVYGSLQNIMDTQLMSVTNVTTTILTVDKIECPAAAYEDVNAPGSTDHGVSVYCQRGSELWKIYLAYNASDTAMSTHIADFNSILDSMKFLP